MIQNQPNHNMEKWDPIKSESSGSINSKKSSKNILPVSDNLIGFEEIN